MYGKINKIYYSKNTNQLSYQITEGCAKGLITDYENYHDYEVYSKEIKNSEYMHDKKLMIFTNMSWMYLVNNVEYANYSTWMVTYNQSYQDYIEGSIIKYFEMNDEKLPDTIYIPDSTKEEWYDYDKLIMKIGNYQKVELTNGDIYKR